MAWRRGLGVGPPFRPCACLLLRFWLGPRARGWEAPGPAPPGPARPICPASRPLGPSAPRSVFGPEHQVRGLFRFRTGGRWIRRPGHGCTLGLVRLGFARLGLAGARRRTISQPASQPGSGAGGLGGSASEPVGQGVSEPASRQRVVPWPSLGLARCDFISEQEGLGLAGLGLAC
jgi:hypothetical protein